jgi:gliding motility-associated-like protein
MVYYRIFVFLFLFILSGAAQSQTAVWAKKIGLMGSDCGYSTAFDNSGNVYLTGYFSETVDFDPGPGVYNLTSTSLSVDGFVCKLDQNGNFVWAKTISGPEADLANDIKVDSNGDLYVIGRFMNTVDFDPGAGVFNLTANGFHDLFVLKLDSDGNFIWAKAAGGTGDEDAISCVIDTDDEICITGYYQTTVDFDPGAGVNNHNVLGLVDIFILKLNSLGDLVWVKTIGGTSNDEGFAIDADNAGNILVGGRFNATVDFDPGAGTSNLVSVGSYDTFVLLLNDLGDFVWAKRLGSTSIYDEASAVCFDDNNNIFVGGQFEQTVDFDPGVGTLSITSNGSRDAFILKLDTNGDLIWAKTIGGVDGDTGSDLDVDQEGNVFLAMNFQNTVDFDPGSGVFNLSVAGNVDMAIVKLNQNGDFGWVQKYSGSAGENIFDIEFDENTSSIYITGLFHGTVDFDPGPGTFNMTSSGGTMDVYVHRLSLCNTTYTSISESACSNYLWQANGVEYFTSGTYQAVLIDQVGCDSVITLNLTINNSTSPIMFDTICSGGNYLSPDGTELWSLAGTYFDTLSGSSGCDSIVQVNLYVDSSYLELNDFISHDNCTQGIGSINLNIINGNDPYSFLWNSGDTTETLSGLGAGTYEVQITDSSGCFQTFSFEVLNLDVSCACHIYVPNVFSPNGDNNNDVLYAEGTCVSSLSFLIFNRWGELVFESNSLSSGWDGNYKGDPLLPGVFAFLISGNFSDGTNFSQEGNITLLK